jgi:NifB/MoaA-like Fe-S oxidoreductase
VTVAGLLTGRDLLRGLKEAASWVREKDGVILIPDVMLKRDAPVFLDDLTPEMLAAELKVDVEVVPATGKGLVAGCCGHVVIQ